jgi:hypothetical protein
VDEDKGFVTLNLKRINGDSGILTATVSTLDGTAKSGEDYNKKRLKWYLNQRM